MENISEPVNTKLRDFSDKLRKLRGEKGVSAREMSLSLGQNVNYINLIENGKRNVTPALLRNLANLYNVDYLDLYEKAGYIDVIEDEKKQQILTPLSSQITIPTLGTVKAGYDYLAEENE